MRMKQFLGILLSLVMVVMMLPVSRAEAQESTPILINSAEEMRKIGQDNDYPLSGNYRLTADITMNAMIEGDFTGTFDGHGHTITLNINDSNYNTGLFKNVKGTIQYLITDGTVSGTWGNTGAIAASLDGGVVRKCWNKAAVHCNQDIASGIVGFMGGINSTIEDCLNTGTITTNDDTNQGYAGGGITCVNNSCSGKVTRCFSTSCPEKGYYLVGGKSTNKINITDCYYAGDLARTGSLTNGGGKLEGDAIKKTESYSNWDFSKTWIMTDEGPRIRMPKDEPTPSNFTYAAPVDSTYDGTAKEATVRAKEGVTGMGQVTVKYYSDAACTTEVQDTSSAGTYYVGITVTEGDSYNATTSVLHDSSWKFTIGKASATVTEDPTAKTLTYNGEAQDLVTAGTATGGTMQYAIGMDADTAPTSGWDTAIPTKNDAGTYYVWYKVKGDENHLDSEPKCVEATATIAKRNVTLTSSSDEKVYDGKPLTNNQITVSDPGWATGEGATYTVNGSQILPGTSSNTFEYTLNSNTKENNYIITQVFGTLKVNDRIEKYEIEVEANSESIKYDSSEHTVSGFETLDFTIDDVDYTVSGLSASAAATDAGTYMVEITGTPVVSNGNGDNLTSQFIVNTTPGRLVINKRNVTLTSASDSKSYDGEPLTNASVTVSGDGFVDGEGAYYNVTGNQTIVGSSSNEFTYTLNEGTKATNYDITTNNGTLTVTNRSEDAKYVINPQANSGSFTYDGTPHSVSGLVTDTFEVDTDETDKTNIHTYKVSGLTAERAETKAGEYTVNISGTAIVTDEAGNNVSSEFRVIPESGSMVINKRNVILTSATDTKVYDGKALTNSDVIVFGDGWAAGEGAKYAVSGTRTLPGESNNSFTYTLNDGTDAENYNITTEEGILTVTDRNSGDDDKRFEITVIANSGKYVYDGVEHEVSGFETNEFVINDVKYTVSGLEASAKGTEIGTYAVKVTGAPIVVDAEGNDVTNQFIVNTQDGELSIIDKSEEIVSYIDYKNTSGDGGIWTKGSGQGLEFVFKRSENDSVTFEHFTGIAVDKADVNPSNYTAVSGSVVVTLKSEYLETLTVGEHQLTAYFDDGDSVTVSFKIISKGEMSDSKTETKSNGKEAINENAKAAKVKSGLTKTADKAQLLIPVLMLLDSIMAVIYIILLKKKVR